MAGYECGDIYEHEWGDTLYCVENRGHDGMHFGKPAGDRNPNAYWTDDDPHRRAHTGSAAAEQREVDATLVRQLARKNETAAIQHAAKANLLSVWDQHGDYASDRREAATYQRIANALHNAVDVIENGEET